MKTKKATVATNVDMIQEWTSNMGVNFSFNTAFKDGDFKQCLKMYGLKIRVAVPIMRPGLMDCLSRSYVTQLDVINIFDQRHKKLGPKIEFIFPERFLTPPYRRSLIQAIVSHPQTKAGNLKEVDIITQDDFILVDCIPQIVRIIRFTEDGFYKESETTPISTFAANRDEIYRAIWE